MGDALEAEGRQRALVVKRLKMLPVECIVRGYITGSGWKDYQASGAVAGIPLPAGLQESEQLPEPIFTPSTKAEEGHDETIDFDAAQVAVGVPQELGLAHAGGGLQRVDLVAGAREADDPESHEASTRSSIAWIS